MIVSPLAASTIVIVALVGLTRADFSTSNRNKRKTDCGPLEFRCQNGDCIPAEKLCDGQADCSDKTDEVRSECMKPEILCPDFAFRCNYGACIDGDATCNGINDCLDKSDEELPKCRTIGSSSNATCSIDEFRCDNGQCVSDTVTCDGDANCLDGSDETADLCRSRVCPPLTFRCVYGACIEESLKCNSVLNCRDGSDEDPNVCGRTKIDPPRPRPDVPPRRPPPVVENPLRRNCRLPSQPSHGRWQLHRSQCQGDRNCDVRDSVDLAPGTLIVYGCDSGYKVRGSSDVYCGPGGQWSSKPVCTEIQCKPLSSASTDAKCYIDNNWVSCLTPVPPNTVAKITCQNSYHKDANVLSNQRENVKCNSQGQWEPEPITCIPECGLIRVDQRPLIVNGTRAKLPEFPWHSTLYRARNAQDEDKQFICGATIIQSNLLITAAHCVYDEEYHRVTDPSTLFVSTGNAFRDYNHRFNVFAKRANVTNVYVNCNFLGLEGNYAGDIAILRVDTHFTFSSLLMPVCIDDSQTSDLAVLEIGQFGKIAGFGRTGPNPSQASSQILQTLTVPYISLNQCHSTSALSNSGRFITLDKFCAGWTNGSSVCDGDSGGGLVFKTGRLYYLRGIVSTGLGLTRFGGQKICDSNTYTLYTRVSSHIEWIRDVLLKVELYGAYPACSSRANRRS